MNDNLDPMKDLLAEVTIETDEWLTAETAVCPRCGGCFKASSAEGCRSEECEDLVTDAES